MAYLNHHAPRRRGSLSAEFMSLLVVLAAGVATFWWAGHKLGLDLSALSTAAAVLGITERTGLTRPVGYSPATSGQQAAPFCNGGQLPVFANGLAILKQQVGDAMGVPVECEHAASAVGDTIQQTSTGLAAYYKGTNTVTFTDGWRHWALTPGGYVSWEGAQAEPPSATVPSAPAGGPSAPAGE